MHITMSDIIPVFLGADLNCYNFARAFHEAYGVESYAYGRYPMAPTKYSKIIHFTTVPDMDNEDTMLRILHEFAAQHKGKRLYLFGCTDDYAAMIIRRKAELTEYIAPGPAADLYGSIQKKAEFYEVCEKFGIPYPDSKILTAPVDAAELAEDKLGFAYPIIVKPSSSVDYWKHPFDTMKKVYTAATPAEAAEIVKTIYASGYPDRMVLQKMVPGGDDHMRVLTAFSDENGKVRAMCLGHTMVEEHTPTAWATMPPSSVRTRPPCRWWRTSARCWRPAITPVFPTLTSSTAASPATTVCLRSTCARAAATTM